MVYRLRVISNEVFHGIAIDTESSIWDNYVNAQDTHSGGSKYRIAIERLHLYNAVDVSSQPFIDFDTEEDAIAFKLKFS